MIRILGINLPENKRIEYALTEIYGISWSRANQILSRTQINKNVLVKDIAEADLKKIQQDIEKHYIVEGNLKEDIANSIKRLKEIGSYRGIRHSRSLPVRGQRTKSNARTKRGKRKTIGAMKKEDVARMQTTEQKK